MKNLIFLFLFVASITFSQNKEREFIESNFTNKNELEIKVSDGNYYINFL